MASLVRQLLDRPVARLSRAERRALRECADNALVMAWLRQNGGVRPLEAFAVEVPLSWWRRQAALRRLAKASEQPAYCCGRPENHQHNEEAASA